jgi:hypothetical protein
MGGTASSVEASMRLSWRLALARGDAERGPRASVSTCRFVPGLPRSVGFGPVSAPPPFCRDAGAVERGPAPVDLARALQLFWQCPVQRRPNPGRVPAAQAAPAGHAGATARLSRQILPRQSVLSTTGIPVSAARSGIGGLPPFGFGRAGGSSGAITAQGSSGTRNGPCFAQCPKPGCQTWAPDPGPVDALRVPRENAAHLAGFHPPPQQNCLAVLSGAPVGASSRAGALRWVGGAAADRMPGQPASRRVVALLDDGGGGVR